MAGGRSGLERARRRHVYGAWHCGATPDEVMSGGASFVAMVQAADLWKRDHLTVGDSLHGSRRWRVFGQREMGPRGVIVGSVPGERAPEMRLIEDDHVFETLSTNGSDQALDKWILPRAQGARDDLADAHPDHTTSEEVAVDRVAIPQEPARSRVVRKGLDDLVGRPRGCGMLRDPKMDNASTVMGQQHEHEQHPPVRVGTVKKSSETRDVT